MEVGRRSAVRSSAPPRVALLEHYREPRPRLALAVPVALAFDAAQDLCHSNLHLSVEVEDELEDSSVPGTNASPYANSRDSAQPLSAPRLPIQPVSARTSTETGVPSGSRSEVSSSVSER